MASGAFKSPQKYRRVLSRDYAYYRERLDHLFYKVDHFDVNEMPS